MPSTAMLICFSGGLLFIICTLFKRKVYNPYESKSIDLIGALWLLGYAAFVVGF